MTLNDSELSRLDSCGLAEVIRSGDVSPVEAVQASIDRIQKLDGELNAVVTERFERALDDAAGDIPDGPFKGVPFILKDLWTSSANEPMHLGNKALKEINYISPVESDLARRYRSLVGLILQSLDLSERLNLSLMAPHVILGTPTMELEGPVEERLLLWRLEWSHQLMPVTVVEVFVFQLQCVALLA